MHNPTNNNITMNHIDGWFMFDSSGWFVFDYAGANHQVPFRTMTNANGNVVRMVLNLEEVFPPIHTIGGPWHWYLAKMFRKSNITLSEKSTPEIIIFDVPMDEFNRFKSSVLDKPGVKWLNIEGTWHSTKQAGGRKRRRGGSRGRGSRRGYRRGPRRGTRRGSRRSH